MGFCDVDNLNERCGLMNFSDGVGFVFVWFYVWFYDRGFELGVDGGFLVWIWDKWGC